MAKEWRDKDVKYLERYVGDKPVADLAKRFGKTVGEVQAKLKDLGLESKDATSSGSLYDDPAVDRFEKGLGHLAHGKWKQAQAEFESVVASGDLLEVVDRARQMLRVCASAQKPAAGGAEQDVFLRAVYEKNEGHYDSALELCSQDERQAKEERFAYLAASIYSLSERLDEAAAALSKAVEMNPKSRIYAYHDPDFQNLRDAPEIQQLFEAS